MSKSRTGRHGTGRMRRSTSRTGSSRSGKAGSSRQSRTGSSRQSKGKEQKDSKPRFYGNGPVQHVRPSRGDGRRPTRRVRGGRRSSSPPVALLVGIPMAIIFVIGALVLFSGDDRPNRRADQEPESAPAAEVETAAPAATATPEPTPAAAPRKAEASDGMRDSDGEETEAEVKERLEAIKRVRAAEQEMFGGDDDDEDDDREILDESD